MHRTIRVVITDRDLLDAEAWVTKYKSGPVAYEVGFLGAPADDVLAHEIWHLMCAIMSSIDPLEHTFAELTNEVYAYNFQALYADVQAAVMAMTKHRKRK